ncbi:MAG: sigma-54 dependent transcriptional regulator [Pseudomonadota bacterium]
MQPNTILVLGDDNGRMEEILRLLSFAGVEGQAGGDLTSDNWRAVLVVDEVVDRHVEALRAWIERALPLILIESVRGARGALPASSWVARLGWPLQHAALHAALRQADACHPARRPADFRPLVGQGPAMQRVRRMVQQVAPSEATVLILGESGTGKEVIARNVHQLSSRRDKPFIPLNCGAIPAELLESELFGHEKGAFTGAFSSRPGRFELAEGGTLFLDEIGDMPLPMQVKLLRVLQERTYERVGGREPRKADVRVIAATHRDLEERIRLGEFREDLYYRLNVFPIETAPLRAMPEDLPLLVEEMIARLEREGRGCLRLEPSALAALRQYPWPGNVRELANLVERLAILFPDESVSASDLPMRYIDGLDLGALEEVGCDAPSPDAHVSGLADDTCLPSPSSGTLPVRLQGAPETFKLPEEGVDLKGLLEDLEVSLIQQALDRTEGIVAQAARLLGIRRTTLVEKMRKYQLARDVVES